MANAVGIEEYEEPLLTGGGPSSNGGAWGVESKEERDGETNCALNTKRTIDGKGELHTGIGVGIRVWGKIECMARGGGKRYVFSDTLDRKYIHFNKIQKDFLVGINMSMSQD